MKWFTSKNVNNYLIKNNEIFSQNYLKYLNWYMPDCRGWSYFSRFSTVRALVIGYNFLAPIIVGVFM